ncbi:hypothetical protein [Spinactinospora alkalitolerans]|uniref:hypothetical protein n=1 Tax=Spinactinospora alkalitolerans TaxID=687207 RepID=UPI001FEBF343|nr:hypothetical protein [Spinactinospora alkalitolerans]
MTVPIFRASCGRRHAVDGDKTRHHALTIAPPLLIIGNMSAGELLVQRLHVDLRQQASALCP